MFLPRGSNEITAAEFAALLDDIEAAYRVAFWTNRVGLPALLAEGLLPEPSELPLQRNSVDAEPAPCVNAVDSHVFDAPTLTSQEQPPPQPQNREPQKPRQPSERY